MATLYGDTTNHWRAYANYSTANSDTATTVTVSGAGMESVDWGFELSGNVVSTTVTLTGKSSLTGAGSFYSDWGTTVQTSYASGSWSITRTTSAQTVTLGVTTVNASGYMDGTSSGSTTLTIPALASYTVKYDANGGSGAPASQTKYFGQSLTLSSTKPTRQYYNFVGWATSASATSASYQPGATYSTNANLTLYAVWTQDYVKPTVKINNVRRCDSSGTLQDDGTYGLISATWSTNSGSNATSLVIEYKRSTQSSSSWTTTYSSNPGASSGTVSRVIGGGAFNASYTYNIRLTVTDSGGSASATYNLQPDAVVMDIAWASHEMGIGRPHPTDYSNMIDVAESIRTYGGFIRHNDNIKVGTAPSSTVNQYALQVVDTNNTVIGGIGGYQSTSDVCGTVFAAQRTISSTDYGAGMYVAINSSGTVTFSPYNSASSIAFANGFYLLQPRRLYQYTSGDSMDTVTLSSSASNFNRIEIVYGASSGSYGYIYATQVCQYNITSSVFELSLSFPDYSTSELLTKTRLISISGTTISTKNAANYRNGQLENTSDEIWIVRVNGYTTAYATY